MKKQLSEIYGSFAYFYLKRWGPEFAETVVPGLLRLLNSWFGAIEDLKVVDIACGGGDVLEKLSRHGVRGTGLDASQIMIENAIKKYPEGQFNRWSFGDPLDILAGKFNFAFCLYDSLNYISSLNELPRLLHSIRTTLKPNGGILIDVNTRRGHEERWNSTFDVYQSFGQCKCAFRCSGSRSAYMEVEGYIESNKIRQRFKERHEQISIEPSELVGALHKAGFGFAKEIGSPVEYSNRDIGRSWVVGSIDRSIEMSAIAKAFEFRPGDK